MGQASVGLKSHAGGSPAPKVGAPGSGANALVTDWPLINASLLPSGP